MIFTNYWKVLVVKFLEIVKTVFFEPKSDRKIIFTDNGKVFVLNFSEMENSVFLWTKKEIETLYLLSLLNYIWKIWCRTCSSYTLWHVFSMSLLQKSTFLFFMPQISCSDSGKVEVFWSWRLLVIGYAIWW